MEIIIKCHVCGTIKNINVPCEMVRFYRCRGCNKKITVVALAPKKEGIRSYLENKRNEFHKIKISKQVHKKVKDEAIVQRLKEENNFIDAVSYAQRTGDWDLEELPPSGHYVRTKVWLYRYFNKDINNQENRIDEI